MYRLSTSCRHLEALKKWYVEHVQIQKEYLLLIVSHFYSNEDQNLKCGHKRNIYNISFIFFQRKYPHIFNLNMFIYIN